MTSRITREKVNERNIPQDHPLHPTRPTTQPTVYASSPVPRGGASPGFDVTRECTVHASRKKRCRHVFGTPDQYAKDHQIFVQQGFLPWKSFGSFGWQMVDHLFDQAK
eukprot:EG_transcript_17933